MTAPYLGYARLLAECTGLDPDADADDLIDDLTADGVPHEAAEAAVRALAEEDSARDRAELTYPPEGQ